MTETVMIGARFHGPPGSGNGGYCCGVVADFIEGAASVRLRVPPPLDVPMEIHRQENSVAMMHDDKLVAIGRPADVDIEIPPPPDYATAEKASLRYRGFASHFYPGCFVCGPQRQHGDGLRVFAGPLKTGHGPEGMVAATWSPDASLADATGKILDRYLWAVLDCPGAYAFPEPAAGAILLGELAVDIRGAITAGEQCVVTGWEIRHDGRKHFTGTALFSKSGACCAVGYATWFEVTAKPT
jgi:hypothetical protein